MPPSNPQNYIQLTDGYLVLDSCKEGVYPGTNRGLQINIGGTTQLQISPSASFTGQGVGILGVGNDGGLFWTSGGGGGGGSPTGPAGGDLGGSYPNPQVLTSNGNVILINGATAGGDLTGTYPNPTVAKLLGIALSGTPSTNQVLEYNGTQWAPANLPSSLPPSGAASGDLSGSYPGPEVTGLLNHPLPGLVDGYLYWDGSHWDLLTIGGAPPTGTAGGDLGGTYPNPIVTGLQGNPVSNVGPGFNQILQWDGVNWIPNNLPTSLPPNGAAGGDLSGTYPNPTVAALQGHAVASTAPTTNYVLTWTGSNWAPQAVPTTSVTGTGLWYSVSGTLHSAATTLTGDVSQGALSGSNVPLEVTGILNQTLPALADGYLAWNGSNLYWSAGTSGGGGSSTRAYYGSGADGTATCDGSTAVTGMSRSGSTYTLTRNVAFSNLTINSGITVKTAGYAIFCNGTLTVTGTIDNSGVGVSGATWALYGGGTNSTTTTGTSFSPSVGLGGIGGTGGGGSGGSLNNSGINSSALSLSNYLSGTINNAAGGPGSPTGTLTLGGGSGGGGGTSIYSGGGGGGYLLITAFILAGNGTISANGGDAPGGSLSSDGGGGGGFICIIYGTNSWSGTTSVAGGAKYGSGANGSAGTALLIAG